MNILDSTDPVCRAGVSQKDWTVPRTKMCAYEDDTDACQVTGDM